MHEPSPVWGSQRALLEELRASRGARGPPARWDAGAPRTLPSAAPPCQDSVFWPHFSPVGAGQGLNPACKSEGTCLRVLLTSTAKRP